MPKLIEDEIHNLEKQASQYFERKKRTEALKNSRAERNHRLIVVGATVEKALESTITEDKISRLTSFLYEAKRILGDFDSTRGDC